MKIFGTFFEKNVKFLAVFWHWNGKFPEGQLLSPLPLHIRRYRRGVTVHSTFPDWWRIRQILYIWELWAGVSDEQRMRQIYEFLRLVISALRPIRPTDSRLSWKLILKMSRFGPFGANLDVFKSGMPAFVKSVFIFLWNKTL